MRRMRHASRYRVRRQLRPSGVSPQMYNMPIIHKMKHRGQTPMFHFASPKPRCATALKALECRVWGKSVLLLRYTHSTHALAIASAIVARAQGARTEVHTPASGAIGVKRIRPAEAVGFVFEERGVPAEASGGKEHRRAIDVAGQQAAFHTVYRGPCFCAVVAQLILLLFLWACTTLVPSWR